MAWEPRNEYGRKLQDPRWQKKRLEIMERDLYQCQSCGDCRSMLNVHHVAYCPYERLDPWDEPSAILVTLCAACHEVEHIDFRESLYLILQMLGECGIRTAYDLNRLGEMYFHPPRNNEVEDEEFHARSLSEYFASYHRYRREDIQYKVWYRDE